KHSHESSKEPSFKMIKGPLRSLAFLDSGYVVRHKISQRKLRERKRQKLKVELQQQMHPWMNGLRELHILNRFPTCRRRRSE
ncbi:hypothetical protein A4A49_24937, partial [Nicotiana attenuata]